MEKSENSIPGDEDVKSGDSETIISGDDIYSALGFSPIKDLTTNIYAIPPMSDGPLLIGVRINIEWAGKSESTQAVIPLEDFIGAIRSLAFAVGPEVLGRAASNIGTLNYGREVVLRMLDDTIEALQGTKGGLEKLLDDSLRDAASKTDETAVEDRK